MKAEKWQFEFKNLKEKFEAVVKEKEVMQDLALLMGWTQGLRVKF